MRSSYLLALKMVRNTEPPSWQSVVSLVMAVVSLVLARDRVSRALLMRLLSAVRLSTCLVKASSCLAWVLLRVSRLVLPDSRSAILLLTAAYSFAAACCFWAMVA